MGNFSHNTIKNINSGLRRLDPAAGLPEGELCRGRTTPPRQRSVQVRDYVNRVLILIHQSNQARGGRDQGGYREREKPVIIVSGTLAIGPLYLLYSYPTSLLSPRS